GFEMAKGEIIVTLDADNTYPPKEISRLLRILEDGKADFVSGDRLTKLSKESMSSMHRIGNGILNLAILVLFSRRVRDSQSGMWVFRKELLKKIRPRSDGMPFSEEIKIEALTKGLRFKEVAIDYRPRKGEIKLRPWQDGWKNLKYIFKLRFGNA
ncbi:MAG: glycosyltransferase, partial [Thermoplasmata archaeon]|nr:glycosyltransferase [Thermoplasmata archaeon]